MQKNNKCPFKKKMIWVHWLFLQKVDYAFKLFYTAVSEMVIESGQWQDNFASVRMRTASVNHWPMFYLLVKAGLLLPYDKLFFKLKGIRLGCNCCINITTYILDLQIEIKSYQDLLPLNSIAKFRFSNHLTELWTPS